MTREERTIEKTFDKAEYDRVMAGAYEKIRKAQELERDKDFKTLSNRTLGAKLTDKEWIKFGELAEKCYMSRSKLIECFIRDLLGSCSTRTWYGGIYNHVRKVIDIKDNELKLIKNTYAIDQEDLNYIKDNF